MEQAFENNNVLLWGENPVKKSLLEKYDKGNKNPVSMARKKESNDGDKKSKTKAEPTVRRFTLGDPYSIDDLDFLNKEYERIQQEFDTNPDNYDELEEQEEKIVELIETLEHMKKISGRGFRKKISSYGLGFKKGSPEAIAHAQKMREAIARKKAEREASLKKQNDSSDEEEVKNVKKTTKARVDKGTEQALTVGQRLAEARKKKAEERKKIEEEKKEVMPEKLTKKPWFYIGDIPKGYREATEEEAIEAKKVSYYGKYVVNINKWKLYEKYGILITKNKTDKEIVLILKGLKRRILKSLEELEILNSKLDNEKYKDKAGDFMLKLDEEERKHESLVYGFDWYMKLYAKRNDKPYKKVEIKLPPKPEIKNKELKDIVIPKELPKPVVNGKELSEEEKYLYYKRLGLYDDNNEEKEEKKVKSTKTKSNDKGLVFTFENSDGSITISQKCFDISIKLKSQYMGKLLGKQIILKKEYYYPDDYKQYIKGIDGIKKITYSLKE